MSASRVARELGLGNKHMLYYIRLYNDETGELMYNKIGKSVVLPSRMSAYYTNQGMYCNVEIIKFFAVPNSDYCETRLKDILRDKYNIDVVKGSEYYDKKYKPEFILNIIRETLNALEPDKCLEIDPNDLGENICKCLTDRWEFRGYEYIIECFQSYIDFSKKTYDGKIERILTNCQYKIPGGGYIRSLVQNLRKKSQSLHDDEREGFNKMMDNINIIMGYNIFTNTKHTAGRTGNKLLIKQAMLENDGALSDNMKLSLNRYMQKDDTRTDFIEFMQINGFNKILESYRIKGEYNSDGKKCSVYWNYIKALKFFEKYHRCPASDRGNSIELYFAYNDKDYIDASLYDKENELGVKTYTSRNTEIFLEYNIYVNIKSLYDSYRKTGDCALREEFRVSLDPYLRRYRSNRMAFYDKYVALKNTENETKNDNIIMNVSTGYHEESIEEHNDNQRDIIMKNNYDVLLQKYNESLSNNKRLTNELKIIEKLKNKHGILDYLAYIRKISDGDEFIAINSIMIDLYQDSRLNKVIYELHCNIIYDFLNSGSIDKRKLKLYYEMRYDFVKKVTGITDNDCQNFIKAIENGSYFTEENEQLFEKMSIISLYEHNDLGECENKEETEEDENDDDIIDIPGIHITKDDRDYEDIMNIIDFARNYEIKIENTIERCDNCRNIGKELSDEDIVEAFAIHYKMFNTIPTRSSCFRYKNVDLNLGYILQHYRERFNKKNTHDTSKSKDPAWIHYLIVLAILHYKVYNNTNRGVSTNILEDVIKSIRECVDNNIKFVDKTILTSEHSANPSTLWYILYEINREYIKTDHKQKRKLYITELKQNRSRIDSIIDQNLLSITTKKLHLNDKNISCL